MTLIRQAIIRRLLTAGEPIVESRIGQEIGAGTALVREALIDLEYQGFVQKIPYKSTYVTKLTRQDYDDIFRLRRQLEALAVEWAAERAAPADLDALQGLTEAVRRSAAALDQRQFYEDDLAFHQRLWQLSGNGWLVEALERLVLPLFACFLMKAPRTAEEYLDSAQKHAEIVTALRAGDRRALRALTQTNVGVWREDLLRTLFPESETR